KSAGRNRTAVHHPLDAGRALVERCLCRSWLASDDALENAIAGKPAPTRALKLAPTTCRQL
ncbi:hypothetical protein M1B35_30665, partial [Pseudomonas sp. MAFF 302046]